MHSSSVDGSGSSGDMRPPQFRSAAAAAASEGGDDDAVHSKALSTMSLEDNNNSSNSFVMTAELEDEEREMRLLYLRQAFCGFFKAKAGVEMENLGRVICAILGLSADEQTAVMESISKIAPAVAVSSTFDSITSSFENLFS
jgi:hypothetical protein